MRLPHSSASLPDMDEHLLEKLRQAATRVFPDAGVLAAYVHGSRVSGATHRRSDLDIGYYLLGHREGAALSVAAEMGLASELTAAAGMEVDLRNLAESPLDLRGRVLEEGVRIFSGDDVQRVGLERDLLGRYHDKDELQGMHEERLKRVAERGL